MPKKRMDTKPRGRMTPYAFFVQSCQEEHRKKHPDETVVFADFQRKCAERWKTMNDKEKKRFQDMADRDRKRYEAEMRMYNPGKGGKGRRRMRQPKDPNAPKRSLSAFFWFCSEERGKIKEANPEYGVGDVAKELGKMWADVTPEDKVKYEQMAEQDKARYDRDMATYKQGKAAAAQMEMEEVEYDDNQDGQEQEQEVEEVEQELEDE